VFLTPTRNNLGIIGPIPRDEFRWENIQRKIAAHPFARDVKTKPRILTLTQSTYDGVIYNVDTIKELTGTSIDTLHFDEAWLPHAAFHEFYRGMHAIGGRDRPRSKDALVFSTQSTHKLLAGLSQASQILVQNSETRQLDRFRFNEAYLMHTSTSPQYAIIASCDVAAAMMEPPGGTALVAESIREALDFRRAMRKVEGEYGDSWWFRVWGPDRLASEDIGSRDDWMLRANERWHGFGDLADGFNMLDPIKATVLTPGLNVDGDFADPGIPAAIVTKYLAEHGIIVEKTGLYSFFIMFTIGITKGRWNSMVTELQQFKDDYDRNQPLWRVLPEFVAAYPRYEKVGLRELCDAIHGIYRANDIGRITTEMYVSNLEPAMKPADAFARMAHREIERVEIDDLEGRVTSALVTPYPPGIPLLIPGERFNKQIVKYLQFARDFNERFPGFDTDIHGLVEEEIGGRKRYFVDCVAGAKVIAAVPSMRVRSVRKS
jgi:arginine decarboxylase